MCRTAAQKRRALHDQLACELRTRVSAAAEQSCELEARLACCWHVAFTSRSITSTRRPQEMADDRQSARSRPSASSGFAELDDPDRTWIPTFRLKSLELASPAPKFSSPAARLEGASPRGWCSPAQNRLPMTSPSSPSARQWEPKPGARNQFPELSIGLPELPCEYKHRSGAENLARIIETRVDTREPYPLSASRPLLPSASSRSTSGKLREWPSRVRPPHRRVGMYGHAW